MSTPAGASTLRAGRAVDGVVAAIDVVSGRIRTDVFYGRRSARTRAIVDAVSREIGERVGGGGRNWGMAEFMVLQMVGLLRLPFFRAIALCFPHWLEGP